MSTMAWQPSLHQPVNTPPMANLAGEQGEGRHFTHPLATEPVLAGSPRLGCSEARHLSPARSPRLLHELRLRPRDAVPPALRELPGRTVPVRYKHNSLIKCHLPVALLGHRCPQNVPAEELRVDLPENELSPVAVGGLAAKTVTAGEVGKSVRYAWASEERIPQESAWGQAEGHWSTRRRAKGPGRVLPRQVDAEDGLGELVLLQQALQHGGHPSRLQRGVAHPQDPVKIGVVERLGWLVLAEPKLLVCDRDVLDLEGKETPGQPVRLGRREQPSGGMNDALKAQRAQYKVTALENITRQLGKQAGIGSKQS